MKLLEEKNYIKIKTTSLQSYDNYISLGKVIQTILK